MWCGPTKPAPISPIPIRFTLQPPCQCLVRLVIIYQGPLENAREAAVRSPQKPRKNGWDDALRAPVKTPRRSLYFGRGGLTHGPAKLDAAGTHGVCGLGSP